MPFWTILNFVQVVRMVIISGGVDHTEGDVNGGMLMINCKANSKNSVVFERTITLNSSTVTTVKLLFTAYVNNATAKTNQQTSKRAFANHGN